MHFTKQIFLYFIFKNVKILNHDFYIRKVDITI